MKICVPLLLEITKQKRVEHSVGNAPPAFIATQSDRTANYLQRHPYRLRCEQGARLLAVQVHVDVFPGRAGDNFHIDFTLCRSRNHGLYLGAATQGGPLQIVQITGQ
jgi:hypothetical protein